MQALLAALALISVAGSAHAVFGIAGCPLFPPDDIWNTPVDSAPLDANSALYVATVGSAAHLHPDFGTVYAGAPNGIPFVAVPGTQAPVPITFTYADESDPGPYPVPPNPPIEGGDASNGDRHVLIVDADRCKLYEIYDARPQADGSWKGGSGAVWNLESNALRPSTWTSADAAGLPILAGLVRYDEVMTGEIAHALRFTAPQTRNEFVWPARHQASNLTDVQYPPMGQRFRLKAGFDISGYSTNVQVILRALKRYGMMLADNGSSWYLSGAPDPRWNDDELHTLTQIPGDAFEAVDVSALKVASDSGQALQAPPPAALPDPLPDANYDIDGNGVYDPLTDGVLIVRYLQGLRGGPLVAGALGANPSRNATQIESYLGSLGAALDVDGNHIADATTDGAMIMRRLFRASGTPLIRAAIGVNASRVTPQAVTTYIDGFTPNLP